MGILSMFNNLKKLFSQSNKTMEKQFLQDNGIQYDEMHGYIIDGFVINELSERLEYLSNRRMKTFNNLKDLYLNTMLINEKIDLEIATKKYSKRVGNTEENLLEFRKIIIILNEYYRNFLRDKS